MNKEKVAEKGELSRERKKEGRKEARKKELPWMSKWSFGAITGSNAQRLQEADSLLEKRDKYYKDLLWKGKCTKLWEHKLQW